MAPCVYVGRVVTLAVIARVVYAGVVTAAVLKDAVWAARTVTLSVIARCVLATTP